VQDDLNVLSFPTFGKRLYHLRNGLRIRDEIPCGSRS